MALNRKAQYKYMSPFLGYHQYVYIMFFPTNFLYVERVQFLSDPRISFRVPMNSVPPGLHFEHMVQSHHNTRFLGCLCFTTNLTISNSKYRCPIKKRDYIRPSAQRYPTSLPIIDTNQIPFKFRSIVRNPRQVYHFPHIPFVSYSKSWRSWERKWKSLHTSAPLIHPT